MNQTYNQLISQTFCDNAIRTVMMIDDEYLPYTDLVSLVSGAGTLAEVQNRLGISAQAAEMQAYFENKKFICDVSDGYNNFDIERARKSDLLILDYELEKGDPKKSIEILSQLSNSPHMNLTVIYTSKDLSDAWMQVAASLKGGFFGCASDNVPNEDLKNYWDEKTNDGDQVPENWEFFTKEDNCRFLLNKPCEKRVFKHFSGEVGTHQRHTKEIIELIFNRTLRDKDYLKNELTTKAIDGAFGCSKWIKVGNVFIAFCSKSADDDSEIIWTALNEALHDWQPNYYRLIASEIQNQIENGCAAINNYVEHEQYSQAAWLWKIIKDKKAGQFDQTIRELLKINSESFNDKSVLNTESISFAKDVINSFSEKFDKDGLTHNDKIKISAELVSSSIKSSDDQLAVKVMHALNRTSSVKEFNFPYITTGTILHDPSLDKHPHDTKNQWLICVSPACDTVPIQNNSDLYKRLGKGFKLLKFIRLSVISSAKALKDATGGKCFFLENNVTLQIENRPNIEYAICHNESPLDKYTFRLSFFHQDEGVINLSDRDLKVIAQLKNSYAARFQAEASHHEGRIGVDYFTYPEDEAS
jgi:hypothetical protein